MADPAMIKRLEETKNQFDGLTTQLGDPSLKTKEMLEITRKRASLEELVTVYNHWTEATQGIEDAKILFQEAGDDVGLEALRRQRGCEALLLASHVDGRARTDAASSCWSAADAAVS